jgi:predicted HTH transcriptional regulator
MIRKPVHDIRLPDLDALVAGAVAESKTIEYKQEMPGGTRDEKIKCLAAVSSFANTAGGDLLIGVPARDGIPIAVSGIAVPSIDDEKLRLENLLADCIEPRIPRVEIAAIPCSGGQHALLVRVHRSGWPPIASSSTTSSTAGTRPANMLSM